MALRQALLIVSGLLEIDQDSEKMVGVVGRRGWTGPTALTAVPHIITKRPCIRTPAHPSLCVARHALHAIELVGKPSYC